MNNSKKLRCCAGDVPLIILAFSLSCRDDNRTPLQAPECGLKPYEELEIRDVEDEQSPGRGEINEVIISRGQKAGLLGLTSCDNTGIMSFILEVPNDDLTPAEDLGVRIRIATGSGPAGFELPQNIIRAPQGVLDIVWNDEEGEEAFAFTAQVSFVDAAGNFGPFSEPFRVEDGGSFF